MSSLVLLSTVATLWLGVCDVTRAFVPYNSWGARQITIASSSTELSMVFDFFKQRSEEGLKQLSNLSDKASKGKFGEGLVDLATYTKASNEAFATGLAKSRNRLLQNLESIFTGSEDAIEDLQDVLLQADLGMATTDDIVAEVRSLQDDSTKFLSRDDLMSIMRGKILEALDVGKSTIRFSDNELPTVLFVLGANGMGKTTTIGKLAHRIRTEGNQTVLLAACDTFRAGAVDQLQQWADRAEVDLYGPSETKKSPSAVLYGALDKAISEKYDTVLVDTSGRLSNNDALTAELAKMIRVIRKRLSVERDEDGEVKPNMDVPHESLLVIDAAQGRMALDSARVWHEEVGLTGLILTKLDGSARGGSVVAVSRDLQLPVKLIGVGEGINDLRDFEPDRFVDGLLGIDKAGGSKAGEAQKLAARLEVMRNERAARAPAMKQKELAAVSAQAAMKAATSGGPPRKPNRPKNKKKKKGKR